ncbi:hypothetical protein KCP70_05505 [Salmonella enterica subsp. enterica]|nr:hypothetical protein KCP70_05505 [Salmonella enterica subsp. enterica]
MNGAGNQLPSLPVPASPRISTVLVALCATISTCFTSCCTRFAASEIPPTRCRDVISCSVSARFRRPKRLQSVDFPIGQRIIHGNGYRSAILTQQLSEVGGGKQFSSSHWASLSTPSIVCRTSTVAGKSVPDPLPRVSNSMRL